MIKITAEILKSKDGFFDLPARMFNLSEKISDWREFWGQTFIPWYLNKVQQNFETEGELGPRSGWPDLEPRYAAWKARHFPGTKILERTRRLRNSLSPSAVGNSEMLLEAGPANLVLGTRVRYARYLTEERPFLPPVPQDEVRPLVSAWVQAKINESGLGGR